MRTLHPHLTRLLFAIGLVALSGCGNGSSPRYGKGVFEAPNPWTKEVDFLGKSPGSDEIIAWLDDNGGWGHGRLEIDFNLNVLAADAGTERREFQPSGDFYRPDCDEVAFPLPEGGAVEGEDGYACTQGGDCHLLVVEESEKKLYEMWRADVRGSWFQGGCAVVWDLQKAYPDDLRGEGCTSADAGGFPVAAMLFSADEVASGSIDHAVRFMLPGGRIRRDVYVHPGTHTTSSVWGDHGAPPYGTRLRLRADFPLEKLPSDGARVIARGLQRYGMLLADGGNVALTGANDRFTEHTWKEVEVERDSLSAIQITDMEVVDMGPPVKYTGQCVRNP
jgi:serine/threonine-protein kinase